MCRDSEVRQITCQQPTNEKASSAVGDALCSHLPKPESLRECFTSCETQWNIGTWSKVHVVRAIVVRARPQCHPPSPVCTSQASMSPPFPCVYSACVERVALGQLFVWK